MKKFNKTILAMGLILGCSLFLLAGCNDDTQNDQLPPVDNTVTETPVDDQGVHVYDEITQQTFASNDEYLEALDIFADAATNLPSDLENSLKSNPDDVTAVKDRLNKPFQQFAATTAPEVFTEAHTMYQQAAEKLQSYIEGYIELNTGDLSDADKETKSAELQTLLDEANSLISSGSMAASDALVNSGK